MAISQYGVRQTAYGIIALHMAYCTRHTAYGIRYTAYRTPQRQRHNSYCIRHTANGIRQTADGIRHIPHIQHTAYDIGRTTERQTAYGIGKQQTLHLALVGCRIHAGAHWGPVPFRHCQRYHGPSCLSCGHVLI